MWHIDTWNMNHDLWHAEGGKHSLIILGPKLLRIGSEGGLKILRKRMSDSLSYEMNYQKNYYHVSRTAPATLSLLIMFTADPDP